MLGHNTSQNTVIWHNFLVWKFCWKTQFPHNFWRIARNCTETVPFHKIPHQEIRWNYGVLCIVVEKKTKINHISLIRFFQCQMILLFFGLIFNSSNYVIGNLQRSSKLFTGHSMVKCFVRNGLSGLCFTEIHLWQDQTFSMNNFTRTKWWKHRNKQMCFCL